MPTESLLNAIPATLVSAALSVTTTMAWNVFTRRQDKRSREREHIHRNEHAQLDVAAALEEFAHQCWSHLVAMKSTEMTETKHSVHWGEPWMNTPIFTFPPGIDWLAFNVAKAAELRSFPRRVALAKEQVDKLSVRGGDLRFIQQVPDYCAFYGKEALGHSHDIYRTLTQANGKASVVNIGMMQFYFDDWLDRREQYLKSGGDENDVMIQIVGRVKSLR